MTRRVTLLTTLDCELCGHARATLNRIANELDLDVDVLDVNSEPGRTAASRAGIVFPPGVLIDGEPFSYGRLSERKLRRALARPISP